MDGPRATIEEGRAISGYLWQLCEGRRSVADYVALADLLRRTQPGDLLQIALHPWHLIVSERNKPLGTDAPRLLRDLLTRLADTEGIAFTTVGAYLSRY